MTAIVTVKTFPGGGASNVMELNAPPGFPKMQIAFSRNTGVVTVTAKAFGATAHTAVTDGAIDLAVNNAGDLGSLQAESLNFNDAGAGEFTVTVISSE